MSLSAADLMRGYGYLLAASLLSAAILIVGVRILARRGKPRKPEPWEFVHSDDPYKGAAAYQEALARYEAELAARRRENR